MTNRFADTSLDADRITSVIRNSNSPPQLRSLTTNRKDDDTQFLQTIDREQFDTSLDDLNYEGERWNAGAIQKFTSPQTTTVEQQEQIDLNNAIRASLEKFQQQLQSRSGWTELDACQISDTQLRIAVKNIGMENDEQTRKFRDFVSVATNFSSMTFTKRMQKIPELVSSVKILIDDMVKEIKEYSAIAGEVQDLIQCFGQLVSNTKHNVKMILPPLTAAVVQMSIVQDALNPTSNAQLNKTDEADIDMALQRMLSGVSKLLDVAKCSADESVELQKRIDYMKNTVQSKKVTIEGRLEIAECCSSLGLPAGLIGSYFAASSAVAAEAFGGAGALVIGGMALNPVTAVLLATVIGGTAIGSIVILVKKLWAKQNYKALGYLNRIFEELTELNDANNHFLEYMRRSRENANKVSENITDIQLCLKSERQRKFNHAICDTAIESTNIMINCLKDISDIDISRWIDSSRSKTLSY
ncbi:unnamed protein product [Didymodactylos carnosus]|uniref:Uncharacterized protein n=1 Tax=Didymodactylos carnosus TaxID=1234261 RepID=A0A814M6G4_9BILA|nr:unnamed protein product [Didymodactylos carnosus]CAF3841895.1 unnamed protein product [Didymodactylos carnosus]